MLPKRKKRKKKTTRTRKRTRKRKRKKRRKGRRKNQAKEEVPLVHLERYLAERRICWNLVLKPSRTLLLLLLAQLQSMPTLHPNLKRSPRTRLLHLHFGVL